jgi:hypothetical protein
MIMPKEEKNQLQPEDPKKVEKAKLNALSAGVIFFMLLIVILWVMNLGMIFKSAPAKQSDNPNVDKLMQGFQNSFKEAETKIGTLKKINADELQKYAMRISTSSLATSTATEK